MKSKQSLNNKIIFNKKIAIKTSKIILETKSYVISFNKPKDKWIKLPDGNLIPCYCNCRYINRDPKATKIIGKYLSNMIKIRFPEAELIVGLETAGISWASIIALNLNLPFAYARGKSKGYGMGKLIECNPPKKLKTVIIDDVYFTGESIFKAINALKNEIQSNILGVGTIINLSNLEKNDNYINLLKHKISLIFLTDYSFILNKLKKEKQINEVQFAELTQFYKNPQISTWS
jgi:orotate phosphoribosyltransferase